MRIDAWLLGIAGMVMIGACSSDPGSANDTGSGSDTEYGGDASGTGIGTADGGTADGGTTTADATTGEPGVDTTSGDTGEPDPCATDVMPSATVVLTNDGPVQGVASEAGPVAFLGIPYAAPPVDALRFSAPTAPECWTELRDATTLGPQCIQLEAADGPTVGEEDCLHLNVWTPAVDQETRPVMVFVHGGGNAAGSGTWPLYDGARLSSTGDVVVVTINYRLGALGWLTHPDLPAQNLGLRDQVAALQWVADNAAAFGGDPGRVTVFGESAGAVNVCALLGSPLAAGLFQGAIIQSGTCAQRAAAEYAGQMSDPLVTAAGCADAPDPVACLRALPAATIVATEPTGFPSVTELSQGWGPSLDPASLPMSSLDAMAAGLHNIVPTIVGANAEETGLQSPTLTVPQYEALVTATFGAAIGAQVLAAYPASDYGDDGSDAWVALISDIKFVCNARRSARAAATGGSPVWRYHFAYTGYTTAPGNDPVAFHGLELFYIFANFEALELPGPLVYTPNANDLLMQTALQDAWISFAHDGVPTTDPTWPSYVPATDPYLQLDLPNVAGQGVRTATCDFLDGLVPG